ncbi:tetratricopeptide repeat protein, partial [uncultured Clostridium sp.]|uniref:tetratricopeptide repeat protein n=1 Tax=uncultured Clostridium sp. TaxID=59620 RepID=UPI0025FBAEC4
IVYSNRAGTKYGLRKYEEAIEDYNKAIELDVDNYRFYNRRGNAKYSLGQYEESIEDYSKAIELNPKDSVLYGNRGNSKYKAKKYKEAIEDYNKAIELDKDNYRFYNYKGRAKKELGKYEESIEDYSKAIDLKPTNPILYSNRGNAKCELKNYEEAIEDYNKAIEIGKCNYRFYNRRGNAKYALKKYEEAIEDYKKALYRNNKDYRAFHSLWLACKELSEIKYEVNITEEEFDSSFIIYILDNIKDPKLIYKIILLYKYVMEIKKECIYTEFEEVAHYTKLNNIKFLIKKDKKIEDGDFKPARLRLNNVAYMNDPTEGEILLDMLKNINSTTINSNIEEILNYLYYETPSKGREVVNGDNHTYLISFSEAIDTLPMWVQYSKDGTGCCLLLKKEFFDEKEDIKVIGNMVETLNLNATDEAVDQVEDKNDEFVSNNKVEKYCLYKVRYISENYDSLNAPTRENIKSIAKVLLDLKKDNVYKEYKNIIVNMLDQIRFLFKSDDYAHEKETRIIKFAEGDTVKLTGNEEGFRVPHLYIEVDKDLEISEVILGPKVEQAPEIATYIKYSDNNIKVTKSKIKYQ